MLILRTGTAQRRRQAPSVEDVVDVVALVRLVGRRSGRAAAWAPCGQGRLAPSSRPLAADLPGRVELRPFERRRVRAGKAQRVRHAGFEARVVGGGLRIPYTAVE